MIPVNFALTFSACVLGCALNAQDIVAGPATFVLGRIGDEQLEVGPDPWPGLVPARLATNPVRRRHSGIVAGRRGRS